MKIKPIIFILSALLSWNSFSQNFYDVDNIREIKLYFTQPNWDYLLDSLYLDGLEERLLASVEIDGSMYDSVGVRYKGFSSVSINTVKNPFNIKLDYVDNNQNHEGFEKIKLSNVIKDPSFLREVLSYEIARDYIPSPRANFANVYVNDSLWGLYVNVEAVNDKFTNKHFSTVNSPLFKCNPSGLNLQPSGENSNLSNTHGSDSSFYYDYYDLKSANGWNELYTLIDNLNNSSNNLDNVLNIDRALWMHAFNYTLINFDSYVGYSQNYYLYKSLFPKLIIITGELAFLLVMSAGVFQLLATLLGTVIYRPLANLIPMLIEPLNGLPGMRGITRGMSYYDNAIGDYEYFFNYLSEAIMLIIMSFIILMFYYILVEIYKYAIKLIVNIIKFLPKFAIPLAIRNRTEN